ncbi:hypothetical protein SASPL_114223 [Salvia splendens]|uniref:Myb/SANT-like domain-containing protein n=1 Tax=Salvia splendens TaxID=180675 RepID=A0A8X8Y1G2_SALSN|nr:hypothetical protein SASPL_114223 [Salvia splendens]
MMMSQQSGGFRAAPSAGSRPSGITAKPTRKFKKGDRYLQKCEDAISEEFPTSDIKGTPHVVSKLTAWKTSYTNLRNILEQTGVGFSSNGDYKIDIDNKQWEHVVQVIKVLTQKPNSCVINPGLYGKLGNAFSGKTERVWVRKIFRLQLLGFAILGLEEASVTKMSSGNTDKPTVTTKSGGEKRKAIHPDVLLMDFLSKLHDATNARLEVISSKIGYDFDLGQSCQAVYDKLGGVEGLTIAQKYRLCNILGDKPQSLEVFMGMPGPSKLGYLLSLLDDE